MRAGRLLFRLVLVALVVLFVPFFARAQDLNAKSIARVEVRGQTVSGQYIRVGTGFLVGDSNIVLTARHLVQPPSPWAKDEVTGVLRYAIYVTLQDGNGLWRDRRNAALDSEVAASDVATLKLEGEKFPTGLSTCPESPLTGAPVLVVRGFPPRQDGAIDRADGERLEASSGALSDARIDDGGRRHFSAPTRPGFSGAPVFLNDKVVGLLTGGTDGRLTEAPQSTFTPLSSLRGKLLGSCPVACRHPEHGVEKYEQSVIWNADSGWRRGGSSPGEFCGAQVLQRSRQFPDRKVVVVRTGEDARWTGPFNRDREYRYTCNFRDDWEPVYFERLSSACGQLAGSSPLPK